jgi:hypothetical protein
MRARAHDRGGQVAITSTAHTGTIHWRGGCRENDTTRTQVSQIVDVISEVIHDRREREREGRERKSKRYASGREGADARVYVNERPDCDRKTVRASVHTHTLSLSHTHHQNLFTKHTLTRHTRDRQPRPTPGQTAASDPRVAPRERGHPGPHHGTPRHSMAHEEAPQREREREAGAVLRWMSPEADTHTHTHTQTTRGRELRGQGDDGENANAPLSRQHCLAEQPPLLHAQSLEPPPSSFKLSGVESSLFVSHARRVETLNLES